MAWIPTEALNSVFPGITGTLSWIHDPDGNRIELYQPVRDDY
ncbi:MAG TPA: VOC family protein [Aeromonadales bacterium]|nr:VOC family protein [Aeromonadales bacterium]